MAVAVEAGAAAAVASPEHSMPAHSAVSLEKSAVLLEPSRVLAERLLPHEQILQLSRSRGRWRGCRCAPVAARRPTCGRQELPARAHARLALTAARPRPARGQNAELREVLAALRSGVRRVAHVVQLAARRHQAQEGGHV